MFLIFYASTLYKFNEKSKLKHLNYNSQKQAKIGLHKSLKFVMVQELPLTRQFFKKNPNWLLYIPSCNLL